MTAETDVLWSPDGDFEIALVQVESLWSLTEESRERIKQAMQWSIELYDDVARGIQDEVAREIQDEVNRVDVLLSWFNHLEDISKFSERLNNLILPSINTSL